MNQEPLLPLNVLYKFRLGIKDQQPVHRDQLQALIVMKKT